MQNTTVDEDIVDPEPDDTGDPTEPSSEPSSETSSETTNSAPIANAGLDQQVVIGSVINLDGRLSTDPDGDPLTYAWTLLDPQDQELVDAQTDVATFEPTSDGVWEIALTVSDGNATSTDEVVVTVLQSLIQNLGAQVQVHIPLCGYSRYIPSSYYDESLNSRKQCPQSLATSVANSSQIKTLTVHFCGAPQTIERETTSLYKEFFNEPGEVITWIVGINVLLYAASILLDSSEALSMKNGLLGFGSPTSRSLYLLGMTGGSVWTCGHWWTVLTASFLHGSILHIYFNLSWLRQLGVLTVGLLGPARFIFAYLFTSRLGASSPQTSGTMALQLGRVAQFLD